MVEGAVIFVLFRRKDFVYYSVLCNLLTNPAMNLLLLISVRMLGENLYFTLLILAELAVVFIEAAVYKYLSGFRLLKCIALSALLNVLSCAAGVLINAVAFA